MQNNKYTLRFLQRPISLFVQPNIHGPCFTKITTKDYNVLRSVGRKKPWFETHLRSEQLFTWLFVYEKLTQWERSQISQKICHCKLFGSFQSLLQEIKNQTSLQEQSTLGWVRCSWWGPAPKWEKARTTASIWSVIIFCLYWGGHCWPLNSPAPLVGL